MWFTPLIGLAETLFGKYFDNKKDRDKALADFKAQLLENQSDILSAQKDIILAEVKGDGWLQRSWRPILMLWFAGLVGAHWLGFTPPNLPESVVNNLLDIVQVGIGGYVIGRSAEKAVKAWKDKE
jgi:hypothetical protein